MIFIHPYFSPKVVISCSSFLSKKDIMTVHETFLPASLIKPLRFFMPLYCLLIIWASLLPSTDGQTIPHIDKLFHFGIYGLLASGFSLAWSHLSKVKIWIGCLLYGGLMEVAQATLTHDRTPSFLDFMANGIGAAIALFFVVLINQKFVR